jgi:hypothetical protein|nr:MAG TPA: hypothetical protein [Caudoviricetes sp.]
MSTKISVPQAVAGAFAIFCISFSIGAKLQTKYLRYLLKITSTSEDVQKQKLAARLVHKSLNLKFAPYDEEK